MNSKKCVSGFALVVAGLVVANGAIAQDKVIQKTTDEQGFEKQLTEIDLMHQTAAQLMSAGQWVQATAELESVIAAEADRLEAWQDLAKCYNELKNYEKAADAYVKAHELRPESLDLLSNLGYAQLRAEQWDGAVTTYETMLELDELSYDANVHLGFILQKGSKNIEDAAQKQQDQLKAAGYYEKALEGKPDDVATIGSLAQLYAEMGDGDKSIAMYQRAIESSSDDQKKQLQSKLGKSLIDDKNWAEAALVYADLAAAEPDNPAYQFNTGISLMQSKQHKAAAGYFEKTIEASPDYVKAYQYLAACYNETGQYNKAVATVKKGLGMAENKAGLYVTWGRSLEKMELYDEAIEIFQRAVGDAQYGGYARKQIQRQEDLKKRARAMSGG